MAFYQQVFVRYVLVISIAGHGCKTWWYCLESSCGHDIVVVFLRTSSFSRVSYFLNQINLDSVLLELGKLMTINIFQHLFVEFVQGFFWLHVMLCAFTSRGNHQNILFKFPQVSYSVLVTIHKLFNLENIANSQVVYLTPCNGHFFHESCIQKLLKSEQ